MSELDLLNKELFGNPDSAISDIKFYPGEGAFQSTVDEIAKNTLAALTAIGSGNCRNIDLSV